MSDDGIGAENPGSVVSLDEYRRKHRDVEPSNAERILEHILGLVDAPEEVDDSPGALRVAQLAEDCFTRLVELGLVTEHEIYDFVSHDSGDTHASIDLLLLSELIERAGAE